MAARRLILFLAGLPLAATPAASAPFPVGTWTEQGPPTVLRFERCGHATCATVVRSQFIDADADARDASNPDPRLRQRRLAGLRIIDDLRPVRGGWAGHIYIPSRGATWPIRVTPAQGGALTIAICPPGEACSRPRFDRIAD